MTTSTGLRDRAERFLALADKASPGPWQTRFLYRLFTRVRMSPGDLEFNTKPQADWPDCEFIEAARNDAPDLIRALLASTAPVGADKESRHALALRTICGVVREYARDFERGKCGLGAYAACHTVERIATQAFVPADPPPSASPPPAEARDLVEQRVAVALCKSGKFETGQGTCALLCMDQLGDPRKSGCSHAQHIHQKLASRIVAALSPASAKTAEDRQ